MDLKKKVAFALRPWQWPAYLLHRLLGPLPIGLTLLNFIVQRIFGINREYRFPVHFSSRVVGTVCIGTDVWISLAVSGGCYIQGVNGITIGNNCLIAPGVKIISANHSALDRSTWENAPPIKQLAIGYGSAPMRSFYPAFRSVTMQ